MYKDRLELIRHLFPKGGKIAEIGVEIGSFSYQLLTECSPTQLLLIDSWRFIPGEYELDPTDAPDRVQEQRYKKVVAGVGKDARVSIMRMLSEEAARVIEDESLDAVYLDADHTENGITQDINLWWPKVKRGGIFAGHDYCVHEPFIYVKPVVDLFVKRESLKLITTQEPWPSWAVKK